MKPGVLKDYNELSLVLAEVMENSLIEAWLETPNTMLDGITPKEAVNRGEINQVWQIVYAIRSGELT